MTLTSPPAAGTAAPPPAAAPALPRWTGPAAFTAVLLLALVVVPAVAPPFQINLYARYLCYALAALGIALAWGKGGMLTLGQGVFFGIGGYAMAMHLKLTEAGPGGLPDFMVWSGVTEMPLLWAPFASPYVALPAVVLLPGLVAAVLGWSVFRQRVRGAYFAILNQALAAAFVILLIGQQGLTGGSNGLTDFPVLLGVDLNRPESQLGLYVAVVLAVAAVYLALRAFDRSRLGRLLVAVRDGEDRVRFLGYDPTVVKTLAYTLSAMVAGLAGALFVPVAGIISPALFGVVPSIELVIAVAIGGRYSLAGAVAGALLLNLARTSFSEQFADGWLYLQGALFIAVIVFAPRGIAGLAASGRELLSRLRTRRTAAPAAGAPAEGGTP
ncbi:urea ABC transporter permease subunit UrtC [Allonocardiopsis opalescens]|uniref:Urea ABC transporter membrane protein n=1 Tax=Allonocardiopsis opalescens TaxID=1144618 RepID=A0A2T0Q516_9ACTN|nr:urea ABC transporter permease subunit UrtC [Allonocardiopsis opalescens]PRX98863.1 urea ABC transporter membrane protein [Allonocardiopsis opalescens]